jgi:protein SCO1/2
MTMRPVTLGLLALSLASACGRKPPPPGEQAPSPPCHCQHDASAPPAADRPTPDTSVFGLGVPWTDQAGRAFDLHSLAGTPTVVLMFYGTCRSACPVLIRDVKRVEAALTPAARARTRFVLVTFDPSNDTPERLRELAAESQLDLSRWSLLRGADDDVRAFATVLGVQFSRVGPGEYTHSNLITLLDPQGVVAFQLDGLQQPVEELARRIEGYTR